MNDKLVSILIPAYNREKLIEETVISALNQTYTNIEIIVVDNKSTDATWSVLSELAERDGRIKIFQNDTNIGPVKNWKRCIDEASGVYAKILWSDDLIAPSFVEKTVDFLEDSDVGFAFTGTEVFVDGTNEKMLRYFIGETGLYDSQKYIEGVLFEPNYPYSPACALFRLKDLKENLLIDIPNKINSDFSQHAIGNDLLIFLLTANKYKKFAFVNEKLSFFRTHDSSITIGSDSGKLVLHYDLAKAYFVENYNTALVKKMNTNLFLHIKKYSLLEKYGLTDIDSFYMNNKNFKIDIVYLIIKLMKRILKKLIK